MLNIETKDPLLCQDSLWIFYKCYECYIKAEICRSVNNEVGYSLAASHCVMLQRLTKSQTLFLCISITSAAGSPTG